MAYGEYTFYLPYEINALPFLIEKEMLIDRHHRFENIFRVKNHNIFFNRVHLIFEAILKNFNNYTLVMPNRDPLLPLERAKETYILYNVEKILDSKFFPFLTNYKQIKPTDVTFRKNLVVELFQNQPIKTVHIDSPIWIVDSYYHCGWIEFKDGDMVKFCYKIYQFSDTFFYFAEPIGLKHNKIKNVETTTFLCLLIFYHSLWALNNYLYLHRRKLLSDYQHFFDFSYFS